MLTKWHNDERLHKTSNEIDLLTVLTNIQEEVEEKTKLVTKMDTDVQGSGPLMSQLGGFLMPKMVGGVAVEIEQSGPMKPAENRNNITHVIILMYYV